MVWRMLIAAVLCLFAAVAVAAAAVWQLARPHPVDRIRQVLRAVAPTQFAAAAMLTAAGVAALSTRPQAGVTVVAVCVAGAVATVAAGCWQSAKALARAEATGGCGGTCATCTLSCR
jgi:hypothetical protein